MRFSDLFKRKSKEELLEEARDLEEKGETDACISAYQKLIRLYPHWDTPFYNLGLIYKYQSNWKKSLYCNKQAARLNFDNEAAHWNRGIAATALMEWREARDAWNFFNFKFTINDDEPSFSLGDTPIRLNPDGNGEVVWGKRIDPARTIIYHVPLPESNHRYNDLVLNDGAAVGYRSFEGKEYPVFNELQLITASPFQTYSMNVYVEDQEHVDKMRALCANANIGFEDWSTMRILCRKCSEGIPHEHHDSDNSSANRCDRNFGFGATDRQVLENIVSAWAAITLCERNEIELRLE